MNKSTPLQPVRLDRPQHLNSTIEVLEQHFDLSADGYLCQTRICGKCCGGLRTPEHG